MKRVFTAILLALAAQPAAAEWVCYPLREAPKHIHPLLHARGRIAHQHHFRKHHRKLCHRARMHCEWIDEAAGGGGGESVLLFAEDSGDDVNGLGPDSLGSSDAGIGLGVDGQWPGVASSVPSVIPSWPCAPRTPAVPVPESSTWALICAGAAALGFLKWRRT